MAESIVQVTEGSGKKLHTWNRTIGANSIEDEFVLPGEFPYASYFIGSGGTAASVATANDHLLQLMAGGTLPVRVRHIRLTQHANATTAAVGALQILRLTTAGTGGTAVTARPHDSADAAAGATGIVIPGVKGTEGFILLQESVNWRQTAPAGGGGNTVFEWVEGMGRVKSIIIPAGTANGIALKNMNATAAATVNVYIEFVETNFV